MDDEISKQQQYFDNLSILEQSAKDIIGVSRTVFDMTNDWAQAQILAELVYWTSPSKENKSKLKIYKEGYRWLACSRMEWWERRRLTPREVDRAIVGLIKNDLVVKKIFYFNGLTTIHLRINIPKYFEQLFSISKRHYSDAEVAIKNESEELIEAMRLMGWDRINSSESPNGESVLPNGESINSNIHSNLPLSDETKIETSSLNDVNGSSPILDGSAGVRPAPKPVNERKSKKKMMEESDLQVKAMYEYSKKAKDNTHTLIPEQYSQMAKWFTDITGLQFLSKFTSLWISGFEEWKALGVGEDDVKAAFDIFTSHNLSIISPGSLTKTLNGIVANRKKKDDYYDKSTEKSKNYAGYEE